VFGPLNELKEVKSNSPHARAGFRPVPQLDLSYSMEKGSTWIRVWPHLAKHRPLNKTWHSQPVRGRNQSGKSCCRRVIWWGTEIIEGSEPPHGEKTTCANRESGYARSREKGGKKKRSMIEGSKDHSAKNGDLERATCPKRKVRNCRPRGRSETPKAAEKRQQFRL